MLKGILLGIVSSVFIGSIIVSANHEKEVDFIEPRTISLEMKRQFATSLTTEEVNEVKIENQLNVEVRNLSFELLMKEAPNVFEVKVSMDELYDKQNNPKSIYKYQQVVKIIDVIKGDKRLLNEEIVVHEPAMYDVDNQSNLIIKSIGNYVPLVGGARYILFLSEYEEDLQAYQTFGVAYSKHNLDGLDNYEFEYSVPYDYQIAKVKEKVYQEFSDKVEVVAKDKLNKKLSLFRETDKKLSLFLEAEQ